MEISLAEAALLAGMIPSANNLYNPIKRPENALARRNKVLDRMLEQGFIDADAHAEAVSQPLEVDPPPRSGGVGRVFPRGGAQGDRKAIRHRRAVPRRSQVHLTMDPYLQPLAERAVREWLIKLEMIYMVGGRRRTCSKPRASRGRITSTSMAAPRTRTGRHGQGGRGRGRPA